jgi:hypothetical protein
MPVNTIKDIPADQVDQIADMFVALGWQVERIEQPDGKWTIIATKSD